MTKNTSEPLRLGGVSASVALFLYRDFITVLEGKYHLVIKDRDPAEKPEDIILIEGDQRSGQALEKCGKFLNLICPLELQSTLREDSFLFIPERQDFTSDSISVRTVSPITDELDLQRLDLLVNGSGLFEQGFVQSLVHALGHAVYGILAHPVCPVDGIDGYALQLLLVNSTAAAGFGTVLHAGGASPDDLFSAVDGPDDP